MVKLARNAPCPCGSGRKYKGCCEQKNERERREFRRLDSGRADLAALNREAADRVLDWLVDVADIRPEDDCPVDVDEGGGMNEAWSAYDAGFLEMFLDAEGPDLPPRVRAWMEAQRAVRIGLWEVLAVERHRSLRLRDRLTGEEFEVDTHTDGIEKEHHIVARLVEFEGRVVIVGCLDTVLPPASAAFLCGILREGLHEIAGLPKRRLLRRDEMRSQRVIATLLGVIAKLRNAAAEYAPPLSNTDGEALIMTEDLFVVPPQAGERLSALSGVEQTESGQWHVLRDDDTVVARVTVDGARLTVFTNSEARADAMRARIVEAIPAARYQGRTAKPLDLRTAPTAPRVEEVPSVEIQAAMRGVLDKHFANWGDVGLPALGGKTPREAARTPGGREKLEQLFVRMQSIEARQPVWQRYGVEKLRAMIGI